MTIEITTAIAMIEGGMMTAIRSDEVVILIGKIRMTMLIRMLTCVQICYELTFKRSMAEVDKLFL